MGADVLLGFPFISKSYSAFLVFASAVLAINATVAVICALPLFIQYFDTVRQPFLHLAFYITTLLSSVLFLPFLGMQSQ